MTREENNREREFNRPRLLRQWRKHNPGVRIRPMLAHSPNYYVTDDGRIFSLRREEAKEHRGKFVLAEAKQTKRINPGAFRGGSHNYWYVHITISANNRKNFPNIRKGSGTARLLVHRLVAYYFCTREFFDRSQVDHIDGNATNNHASNLEWVTPAENYRRAKELRRLKKLRSVTETKQQTTKN